MSRGYFTSFAGLLAASQWRFVTIGNREGRRSGGIATARPLTQRRFALAEVPLSSRVPLLGVLLLLAACGGASGPADDASAAGPSWPRAARVTPPETVEQAAVRGAVAGAPLVGEAADGSRYFMFLGGDGEARLR